ncbi:ATPase domain-containing protein [Halodurantibacterium flavum]|uniref:non-specific serine/threonine protein kinase n=1 Tax=Halodurantibacterium flavum TaxID=1382802 RepID=A0ABW4S6I1_9RHOB
MKNLTRIESGVQGLDTVLGGGLLEGAAYIVQGSPGAGKTILSNQIAFHRAAQGGRVLYVTLLSESHDRLFQALGTLDFFDPQRIGNEIIYLSVFQTLRESGLDAVVHLLRSEIKRHGARLLVFDGLLNARDRADSDLDVKTFVAEVQGQAAFAQCTVLFLTSTRVQDASPEHTMVDGVIELSEDLAGVRSIRRLQVRKSRGSAAIGGLHQFEIGTTGLTIYPRYEATAARSFPDAVPPSARIRSGCSDLDEIAGGGFPAGSITLLLGPSGSGKTTLGLQFLSAASADEPALHFGFLETPARLRAKAKALGLPLPENEDMTLLWNPLTENLLDKLGWQLLSEVRKRGIRRLFIDGLTGFERAAIHPTRLTEFLAALTNELRNLGVTTLATWETVEMVGSGMTAPAAHLSALHDNLIILQRLPIDHTLVRTIAIQKMRDSDFTPATFGLVLSSSGLTIGNTMAATPDPNRIETASD